MLSKTSVVGKLMLLVLAFAAVGTSAGELEAPTVKYHGYINGKMGVITKWIANHAVEFEAKPEGADDSAYVHIGTRAAAGGAPMPWNNYCGMPWTLTTNFVGSVEVRARHVSGDAYSAWTHVGSFTATVRAVGTTIGLAHSVAALENAFDGDLTTMIDATGDTSSKAWVGKKFDHPTRIKAIRYLPRPDTCRNRYQNSIFEVASDDTFSDAQTVHTCPTTITEAMLDHVQEVTFDPPLTCGAIRHNKGQLESTLELEFVPSDPPWEPDLRVDYSDLTNFHPVVTWTLPGELGATKSRLLRSIHADGPFAPVSEWISDVATPCVTNDDQYVSVPYYYVVEADCHSPFFPTTTAVTNFTPVTATRCRRLDRDWSDETKFRSGVTMMPLTNGTVSASVKNCFDGKYNTHGDLYNGAGIRGPVGVDFGENVWVIAVGYVCRNDNACYTRIKDASLFCTDGEDVLLANRVPCSERMKQASQDTKYYWQAGTFCPAGGARRWFLYQEGSGVFYCNVAEVAFFGWTQADLDAAPVVTPPTAMTFERAAGGLGVSWSGGNNAQTFTLERRLRGSEEWTVVAQDVSDRTFVDAGLAAAYYEYRVTASGEFGTATSATFGRPYYVPGSGTGLRGAVWSPYVCTNGAYAQYTTVTDRGVEAVALDLGTAPVAGLETSARLVWTGTIDCPFAGDYVFTLTTDGGGAVWIDGADVCNAWSGTGQCPSGVVTLKAGSHEIRVDYRMADGVGDRAMCILSWGGVVPNETVPASQLSPASEPAVPTLDEWTMQSFGMTTVGKVETISGGYRVTGSTRDMSTTDTRRANEITYLGQEVEGDFDFSAYAKLHAGQHGNGYLMLRNACGDFVTVYARTTGQAYSFAGVRTLLPGKLAYTQGVENRVYESGSQGDSWLRIVRSGSTITLMQRLKATDEWNTYATIEDTDHAFDGAVSVGIAASSHGGASNMKGVFNFTNIKLHVKRGLVLLVR